MSHKPVSHQVWHALCVVRCTYVRVFSLCAVRCAVRKIFKCACACAVCLECVPSLWAISRLSHKPVNEPLKTINCQLGNGRQSGATLLWGVSRKLRTPSLEKNSPLPNPPFTRGKGGEKFFRGMGYEASWRPFIKGWPRIFYHYRQLSHLNSEFRRK